VLVNVAVRSGALLLSLSGGDGANGLKQIFMFHQFTWQQFLVTALILSFIWYAALFLFFFRGRLKERLSGKKESDRSDEREAAFMRAGEEDFEEAENPEESLMGKPELPEGMSRVGMHQVLFAGRNPEVRDWVDEGRRLGLVPDVIEELKEIFRVLEQERGTKQDFFELFAVVKEKYPGIAGTGEEKALNNYIRENVLFPVSDAELDALWR